jgi:hypothetical protein
MAILDLTVQNLIAKYPATPLAANAADITWTAAGAAFADGFRFPHTGKEILLVRNDNAGPQTVTINSVANAKGRSGSISTYSVGIGEYAAFPPFPVDGWRQTSGYLTGAASAADVYLAVLRLPD